MLNGRYDLGFSYEGSQEPMFRLRGTDPARKRHRLTDHGHVATPTAERMKETLDWFDQYLGPVKRKSDPVIAPE
jgi:hypothetical protein